MKRAKIFLHRQREKAEKRRQTLEFLAKLETIAPGRKIRRKRKGHRK